MFRTRNNSQVESQPYWNPYLAGFGLGVTLLAAFLIAGRGLGASGGFTTILAWVSNSLAPVFSKTNSVLSAHLQNPLGHPLKDWLVIELTGVLIGGLLSGWLAGRLRLEVMKGDGISIPVRLLAATGGGFLMGFAAKLARGCTSGQALSGGALLNLGSWIFMLSVFAGGYGLAWFVRRLWR